jgi:hypothetical protein
VIKRLKRPYSGKAKGLNTKQPEIRGMASTFRDVLLFFDKIGIYDVVLPFLLVFTIVFAIFEKTKVLGTETIEGKKYTRKSMNAMVAFVISFLVIASTKLVEIITQVSANMVLLILLSVFFLLLVGSFYKESEEVFLSGGWRTLFMLIMFVGISAIFLHAIPTSSGEPWLTWFVNYVIDNFDSSAVGSIVLIVIMVGFMYFITKDNKPEEKKKE